MFVLLILFLLFVLVVFALNVPAFGGVPSGARLARIRALPNYNGSSLDNLSDTPVKPPGVSYLDMIRGMLKKNVNRRPALPVPFVRPVFSAMEGTEARLTWFGHSSYLLQVDGLNVLVDPVFSPRTSPFSFLGTRQYPGTDFLSPEDLPDLDIVLITHDHYDHLDYRTILRLKHKTRHFLTSLGAGVHLEKWGVTADRITELAWGDAADLFGLSFRALPARHFTGRKFKRNQTVWSAFVLQTAAYRLYLGGDSGYDVHFKAAGDVYGPFDLALLECGQYNVYWPHIHMFPEQTVQAAIDLRAKILMPVHWGKFTLAMHDWNEPVIRAVKAAAEKNVRICTPLMGESVILDQFYPERQWWLNLDPGSNNVG